MQNKPEGVCVYINHRNHLSETFSVKGKIMKYESLL